MVGVVAGIGRAEQLGWGLVMGVNVWVVGVGLELGGCPVCE